jgi:predicted DNA-binding transcriptional regulator YafY
MFKLKRLWDLRITESRFEKRGISDEDRDYDAHLSDDKKFEAVFDKSVEYLVVETYGPDSYTETDEGRPHLKGFYTNLEYIISWVLGFGDKMRVIAPQELADEIKNRTKNILENYERLV